MRHNQHNTLPSFLEGPCAMAMPEDSADDIFLPGGRLRLECFSDEALRAMRESLRLAGETRWDSVRSPHVFMGLLAVPDESDLVAFLLSDGNATKRPKAPSVSTLHDFFENYFDSLPDGCVDPTGLSKHQGRIHMNAAEPTRNKS